MTRKKMSKLNVKIIQSSKFIHSEGNITVSLLIHASSVAATNREFDYLTKPNHKRELLFPLFSFQLS